MGMDGSPSRFTPIPQYDNGRQMDGGALSSSSHKRALKKVRHKRILVINAGTYCDGSLMDHVLDSLTGYEIIYVTDENVLPQNKKGVKRIVTYSTPSFVLLDPHLGPADSNQNPIRWAFANPVYAARIKDWVSHVGGLIADLEKDVAPDCVMTHFSMMAPLLWAEKNRAPGMFGFRPHVLMYLYPGIPNKTIPWLFDSRMKSRDFEIYNDNKTSQIVMESWSTILARVSMVNGISSHGKENVRDTMCSFRDFHHAVCWDRTITPQFRSLIRGMKSYYVGSYVSHDNKKKKKRRKAVVSPLLSPDMADFIAESTKRGINKRKLAFISFGSFGHAGSHRIVAVEMIRILIRDLGYAVIFHETSKEASDNGSIDIIRGILNGSNEEETDEMSRLFYIHQGFVPYDDVVDITSLVVFTGSMCLQSKCLTRAVPMVFAPLLTEQFFWAKNYQHFTGMPYIDVNLQKELEKKDNMKLVASALKSKVSARRTNAYLTRVRRSLSSNDSKANTRDLVKRLISEEESRKQLNPLLDL